MKHFCRYPLFIRLEIHLNVDWQVILVDMLCDIFGDKLYQPKNDTTDWTQQRPTPKDFQMKIILVVCCTNYILLKFYSKTLKF